MSVIKQGDKVRVSKDAPRVYQKGSIFNYSEHQSTVHEVDGDAAIIGLDIEDSPIYSAPIAIPTKYLVKVDAEAKEANVKIGDKVVVHYPSGDRIGRIQEVMLDGTYDIDYGGGCTGHNITRSQIEPYVAPKIKIGDRVRCKHPLRLANSTDNDFIGIVTDAVTDGENGWFNVRMNNGATFQTYHKSDLELIEPAEQTEAEKFAEQTKLALGMIDLIEPSFRTIPKIMFNTEFWVKYEADLAKEVSLKVANKYNDPEQAAEYAVSVAKAVVEGLKRE